MINANWEINVSKMMVGLNYVLYYVDYMFKFDTIFFIFLFEEIIIIEGLEKVKNKLS